MATIIIYNEPPTEPLTNYLKNSGPYDSFEILENGYRVDYINREDGWRVYQNNAQDDLHDIEYYQHDIEYIQDR